MRPGAIAKYLLSGMVLCVMPVGFALWASAHPLDAHMARLGWLLFGFSNAVLLSLAGKGPKRYRIKKGGGHRRRTEPADGKSKNPAKTCRFLFT